AAPGFLVELSLEDVLGLGAGGPFRLAERGGLLVDRLDCRRHEAALLLQLLGPLREVAGGPVPVRLLLEFRHLGRAFGELGDRAARVSGQRSGSAAGTGWRRRARRRARRRPRTWAAGPAPERGRCAAAGRPRTRAGSG